MAQVLDWHAIEVNGNAGLHRALRRLEGELGNLQERYTVQDGRLERLEQAFSDGLQLIAELARALAGADGESAEDALLAGSGEEEEAEVALVELNPEELQQTAADMLAVLDGADGGVERVLAPYYLALYQRAGRRRLHVGLTERRPTLEEVQPALAAFGVPADTEPEPWMLRLTSQTGHSVLVLTLRFPWTELGAEAGGAA